MLLVEMKLWASPHFFSYDFYWSFNLIAGCMTFGSQDNVPFLLKVGMNALAV
jgi:hypothetical protein